ncbi:MalY/PatB family protein [uncultured Selenomonas sp.]|uniref:MalY/PatB family protein n=1 Tax=uncultured Selenomonas sp. TaxID=159275 RepID=UPI0025CEF83D|nr:MalY/PatB family protein [uncultured Selenomonas sp.]
MDAYNFDEVIDRKGTNCLKYDFALERGYPEGVLPFWVADMDFRTAPPVIEELERRVQHGIFGYTDPGADSRAAVWNWMKTQHDWTPAVGSLTITPGVVFALGMAVQSFTAPGDAVLIQQPVYYPFSSIILGNDRQLVNSPLVLKDGHYEIDFVDFEQKITSKNVKLFLLCNPHNPAGRVYTRDELQKMATICLQHGVTIVADEIHNDFIRKGYEHTVLASLGNDIAQHVVTCTAPSKTFNLAGLQISNIFIENESMRQKFRATIDHAGYSQPNALGMFAAQAAYEKGLPWLEALRDYLEQNYQKTKAFLAQHLPKVTLIEPEGTYLLWLDFRAYGLSAKELDHLIVHEANLWLDSGHIFGKDGEGFERLNIACPWATLEQGLKQLARTFKNR